MHHMDMPMGYHMWDAMLEYCSILNCEMSEVTRPFAVFCKTYSCCRQQ